jgi:serine/threonine protein kinase
MVGKTVSHYRIVRQLGAGGMGVVYAAEDPRLNRQVALKFVPEDLAHDPHSLARLRSEARTASGLNHPNICTIYDIGEYEGRPFIVMELLKGQTLRERMETGRLKITEAVDMGIQAAEGLFWAHSKDVIHRDIKPANLFLCDQGPLKILDFGLAKQITPQPGLEATLAPTVDLTGVGVAVGTVAYMSPEQVGGDKLDRRTDLFSVGVVLYECVTGQQPFQGKTSAVILASILTQQPTPPILLNSSIPPGLQDVIHACLEKDRELRYQDAGSLRADLKRVKRDLDSGALGVVRTTSTATSAIRDSQSSISTTQVPARPPSGTTTTATVVTVQKNRGLVIGLSVAAAALAVALVSFTMFRGPSTPTPEQNAAAIPATPATTSPAPSPPPAADTADSARRREDAARFDQAIVDGNRYLAEGDADAANRELGVARAIDPVSPKVADLSARLVEHFRAAANARRLPAEAARPTPPSRSTTDASAPRPTPSPPAVTVPSPAPPPTPAASAPSAPAPVAQTPTAPATAPAQGSRGQGGSDPVRPPAVAAPTPPPTPATRSEPAERRAAAPPAAPASPVEDDEAAIRRLVAAYGRAIETKDIALFRTLKPNLTPGERQTIENGFRAVGAQQVTLTIESIERQGPEASVRLRRHDVVEMNGRQRTVDNEQTLRVGRSPAGWIILRIGR